MTRNLVALIFAALIGSTAAAQATAVISVPGISEAVSCSFSPPVGTPTVQSGTTGCAVTGAQISIATDPFVLLQASGAAALGTGSASMAQGSLAFSFEVVGGTQSEQIPILVTTDLATAIKGNGGAGASITIAPQPSDPSFDSVRETVCSNANGCPASESAAFDGTLDVTALDGVAAEVSMFVIAGGGSNAVESGSAIASADPLIEIDPTFLLDNPGLTLVFSADIGNGLPGAPLPVPEPSSLALLAAGLAALVGWRWLQPRSGQAPCWLG